ncbi:MAG: cobyric acid synthase [Nitriliruptorales bacterium]
MKGAILLGGTGSDVGKSVLVAGLCRWLSRCGVKVAPFKAQNMALNSVVTPDGGEIGRAQAAQAAAAGVAPEVAMNPVLIKPTGERHSQVVVMGRAAFNASARSYRDHGAELLPVVIEAFSDLSSRFDVVVCEGAGSIAEMNLRRGDLANLGLARALDLPVVVVGDIDRGGVFAAFYGSLALLEAADQAHVAGFIVNRFRGDRGVLAPGLRQLAALTGRPVLGVLPHQDGLWLDAEDSLSLDVGGWDRGGGGTIDALDVVVVRLPRISNFTDVDALTVEPGVSVRFSTSPAAIARADLAILPGSKSTVDDLSWLRRMGIAGALLERAAACRPILAVCGGYQMLGRRIVDEFESGAGEVDGIGLLPVETRFEPTKHLDRPMGVCPFLGWVDASGYEIRHGRTRVAGDTPFLVAVDGSPEGCVVGSVIGTSWHGLLEGDVLRRALLRWVADTTGRDWRPGIRPFEAVREERLDRLGDLVAAHLDTEALTALIDRGPASGLPLVPPAGVPEVGR